MASILSLILAMLIFRISSTLPAKINQTCEKEASTATLTPENMAKPLKLHIKELAKKIKFVLSNRAILFILICTTSETFILKGFSSYLTKYLEFEYRLESATAAIIVGTLGLISIVFGSLLGAFLVKRYHWKAKKNAKFLTVVLSSTVILFLGFILYCPQEIYIKTGNVFFENSGCNCDNVYVFSPVCYKTEYIFKTPCHAGCFLNHTTNNYADCIVLDSLLRLQANRSNINIVQACDRPAHKCMLNLVLVCFVGFAILFLSSLIFVPFLRILLESAGEENQSFALGIRSLVTKLFGKNKN